MADKWSKYEVSSDSKEDKWAKYEVKPEEKSTMSKWESLLRGAIQGSTMGFGDEAQAAIRALSPIQINATEGGWPTIGKNEDFGEYKKLRDAERANNATSAADNPGTTLVGNIAGSLPQGIAAARGATLAGGNMLKQAMGAGKVGAKIGAIQGLGNTEDIANVPQVAQDVAVNTGLGAASNAAAIPIAKGVSTGLNKLSMDKLAALLKKNPSMPATAQAAEASIPATATSVLPQISMPALGALGGMGYRNIQSDNPTDWSTDPYSAAIDTGIAGAGGAALGVAAKYGTKIGGTVAGKTADLAKQGYNAARAKTDPWVNKIADNERETVDMLKGYLGQAGEVVDNLATHGTSNKPMAQTPSATQTFSDYLKNTKSGNPQVQQAAKQAEQAVGDGADDAVKRQAAMELQSSSTGRAVTNTESSVHNQNPMGMADEGGYKAPGMATVEDSEDALMKQLQRPEFDKMRKILKDHNRSLGSIAAKERRFGAGKVNEGVKQAEDDILKEHGWNPGQYRQKLDDYINGLGN